MKKHFVSDELVLEESVPDQIFFEKGVRNKSGSVDIVIPRNAVTRNLLFDGLVQPPEIKTTHVGPDASSGRRSAAPQCTYPTRSSIVILSSAVTSNLLLALIIPLLLMAILVTCTGYALGQNPSYEPDYKWHAPAKAALRKNPLASTAALATGGKKIFLRDCAECHQSDGSGLVEKHSADLRSPVVQSLSDGALFWKISNGNSRRGMPSFSRLPENQRWQLVLFLRTLRSQGQGGGSR